MVPIDPYGRADLHADVHSHSHSHSHSHGHAHAHGQAAAHPAQPAPWSILRMPVTVRLGAAAAVSAGLWVIVWLAMR